MSERSKKRTFLVLCTFGGPRPLAQSTRVDIDIHTKLAPPFDLFRPKSNNMYHPLQEIKRSLSPSFSPSLPPSLPLSLSPSLPLSLSPSLPLSLSFARARNPLCPLISVIGQVLGIARKKMDPTLSISLPPPPPSEHAGQKEPETEWSTDEHLGMFERVGNVQKPLKKKPSMQRLKTPNKKRYRQS